MSERFDTTGSLERPRFLFHGSPRKEVSELKRGKEREEGAFLFASPDPRFSSFFLMDRERYPAVGGIVNEIAYACIRAERDDFVAHDVGGTIYTLPSDSFDIHDGGFGAFEYKSSEPVKPVEKTDYPSALDQMIASGLQVFFLSQEEFERLKVSDQACVEVLSSTRSENQVRDPGARSFKELIESEQ